mgnify:CR=1 FL=1
MAHYDVLVDSSVWIHYFKSGGMPELDQLINEGLACINELIFTELAPVLVKNQETEVLDGLQALPFLPLNIDWQIIRRYQLINLKNGINKVGIPDLIIIQQVIEEKVTLYSLDKHFHLMQEHLSFELIDL